MSGVAAKLVTIIVSFELKGFVEDELDRRAMHGYSIGIVEGRGRHGHQAGGFLVPKNYQFSVVTTEAKADALLAWVDSDDVKNRIAIAFVQDIKAVPQAIVH